jgi:hypothetical protein
MIFTKYIFRAVFLLITVFLIVYINTKTDNNAQTIAEFKYETLKKLKPDSLDARERFDLLLNETKKFSEQNADDSSHIRRGIRYLIATLTLLIIFEISLFALGKRKVNREE